MNVEILRNNLTIWQLLTTCCLGFALCIGQPAQADNWLTGVSTSWLGNSYPGSVHVPNYIDDLDVTPAGMVCTMAGFDEGQSTSQLYKDGILLGALPGCGPAIACSDRYIYMVVGGNHGLTRMHFGKDMIFNPAAPTILGDCDIHGIALKNDEVYISDFTNNLIRVWNAELTAELRTFACQSPDKIAVDRYDQVWVALGRTATIRGYSNTGTLLREITDAGSVQDLAIDNIGRLMVADSSSRQQIRFYSDLSTTPTCTATFGELAGVFGDSLPGKVGGARLCSPTGVAMDAAGNIYVANNSYGFGVVITAYKPDGTVIWEKSGRYTLADSTVMDPEDENVLYTKGNRYTVDWNKPFGQEATCVAATFDPFRFHTDPRLSYDVNGNTCTSDMKVIKGHKFLCVTSGNGTGLMIFRKGSAKDGETFIPSVWFNPDCRVDDAVNYPPHRPTKGGNFASTWIWRDTNGNGLIDAAAEYDPEPGGYHNSAYTWLDSNGNIWRCVNNGFQYFPLQGFDAHGNPIYSFATMQYTDNPAPFIDTFRVVYLAETDSLYISGRTDEHPERAPIGRVINRYDKWSEGNRTAKWSILLPEFKGTADGRNGMREFTMAGDYLFAGYLMDAAQVEVYNLSTGAYVGTMPVNNGMPNSGWLDTTCPIHAYRRANGEYVVFVEDVVFNKNTIQRWTPVKVQLTTPRKGSLYTAPKNITLNATASSYDGGAISKVEFYNGTTLLNTDSTLPYSYTWNNVAAGSYNITAKVTDVAGNWAKDTATISVTNAAATGLKGEYFNNNDLTSSKLILTDDTVNFDWAATSPDASINADTFSVRWTGYIKPTVTGNYTFYTNCNGGERLWVNNQPLITSWHDAVGELSGTIALTANTFYPIELEYFKQSGNAKAVLSWSATGVTKQLVPKSACYLPLSQFDLAPACALTQPVAEQRFNVGSTVTLAAKAVDWDQQISKVGFYQGTTKLGESTAAPYSYSWINVPQGQYSLTARAYDNGGNITRTDPLSISVTAAPTVALTTPTNWQHFAANDTVTLTATPADSDGSISRVEFYNGTTKLGQVTANPYTYNWTNVPHGAYTITALAVDNNGATTISTATPIVVSNTTVTVTAPAANHRFPAGEPIDLTASASIAAGTISRVDFFNNDRLLGSATTPPYTANWIDATVGNQTVAAVALDNTGKNTTSAPVAFTVEGELPVTSGLVLWLDATRLTLADDTPVDSWSDLSGQGNDAKQQTANKRPIYKTAGIFGKPSLHFSEASSQSMQITPEKPIGVTPAAGAVTTFAVYSQSPGTHTWQRIVSGQNAAGGNDFENGICLAAPGAPYGPSCEMAVNPLAANTGISSITLAANSSDQTSSAMNGDIAEVICYDRVLTLEEREAVYGYLQNKYRHNVWIWHDFEDGINPFVDFSGAGNRGTVMTVATPDKPDNKAWVFSAKDAQYIKAGLSLGEKTPLANRIWEIYNRPLGSAPVTFSMSYKIKRLAAGSAYLGRLGTGELITASDKTAGGADQVNVVPGWAPVNNAPDGAYANTLNTPNWLQLNNEALGNTNFTIIPKGENSYTLTRVYLEFYMVGDGAANESVALDDLLIEELVPSQTTVAITAPSEKSTVTIGKSITLSATVTNKVQGISRVQFMQDGLLIGEDSTSPYSITWKPTLLGNVRLTAIAYDDSGRPVTSQAVTVLVQAEK